MTAAPRTKSSKKLKTEALGVLLSGGGIEYVTDHERDTMKGGPTGTPIAMRPVGDRRNLNLHRKFWKLFSCWEPDWTFASDPGKWIAHEVAKTLATQAGDPLLYGNITKLIADSVLQRVAAQRQRRFDAEAVKTTEAYLNYVMVKAGFYDLATNPDGGTLKHRLRQHEPREVRQGSSRCCWSNLERDAVATLCR
ncbi:DUF1367 family protein [Serratia marcescens]|uniref:DUF1367 family protein n=1 Tax=Serratia TaxID=613 RepID=UPI001FAFCC36